MSSLLLQAQLHLIERSARVRRYHTEPVNHQQNVGEHTYGVMWIVLLITNHNASRNLLLAALMHDTAEFDVGDIPAPTKRMGDLKVLFDAMEDEVMARHQLKAPDITDTEAVTLKLADCLEGALFCSWQVRCGNIELLGSLRNYVAYIDNLYPRDVALDILNIIKERHRGQL